MDLTNILTSYLIVLLRLEIMTARTLGESVYEGYCGADKLGRFAPVFQGLVLVWYISVQVFMLQDRE